MKKFVAIIFTIEDSKSIVHVAIVHSSLFNNKDSLQQTKMLASVRPKRELMATPSIGWYITLLKLNSTDLVAVCMSSMKTLRGIERALRLLP